MKEFYDTSKSLCKYCADGMMPFMIDKDGVDCFVSGNYGTLHHAYSDYLWRCPIDRYKHPYKTLLTKEAESERISVMQAQHFEKHNFRNRTLTN